MQFGWTADESTSIEVLTAAYESGINFIDTADIYSRWAEGNPGGVAETIIGKWLKKTGVARDNVVVATKVRGSMGDGPNQEGLSRKWVFTALENSLRRLNTEYIDLYQLHWPDESTPIDETLSALDDLVRLGLIRYIGCSNFSAWRLVEALWSSERNRYVSFVSLQPHYSLVHRDEFEGELEETCINHGLGVIPYSPLGGGFLTGKYRRDEIPPADTRAAKSQRIQGYISDDLNWKLLEVLEKLGEERGKTISQIALGWLLTRSSITSPIIGPKTVAQLEDNLGAVGVRLDKTDVEMIEAIGSPKEST
jgi:aryl-alcohol dehydrogenase-like predicted oxidoreductase